MKDKPKFNQLWTNNKNKKMYWIYRLGKMKIQSSCWVESVTYYSVEDDQYYTRDMETFLEKFTKFQD